MAKRLADSQGRKETGLDGDDTYGGSGSTIVQKATPAQMARRKIAQGRSTRPGAARVNHGHGTISRAQQSFPSPFGNVDLNTVNGPAAQQNGFTFSSNSSTTSQPSSQQPAFMSMNTPFGLNSSTTNANTFGSQPAPPTSGFNFALNGSSSFSNPFSVSSNGVASTSTPGGSNIYQGDLFQMPASQPTKSQKTKSNGPQMNTDTIETNAAQLWAPHSPFLQDQSDRQQSNSTTSFTNGLTQTSGQQSGQSPNIFGQSTSQQPEQSQQNFPLFGQKSNQPQQQAQSQSAPLFFGQNSSQSQQQSSQPATSFFSQNPSQHKQSQPSFALFGQNASQSQQQQSQPSFSFGQTSTQHPQPQSQAAPSLFGLNASQSQSGQSTPNLFGQIQQPSSTTNMFAASSPGTTSSQNNLFGNQSISQAQSEEPNAQTSSNDADMSFSPPHKETSTTPQASPTKTPFAAPQSSLGSSNTASIFGTMGASSNASSIFTAPTNTANIFSRTADSSTSTTTNPFGSPSRPILDFNPSSGAVLSSVGDEKNNASAESKSNNSGVSQNTTNQDKEPPGSVSNQVFQDKESTTSAKAFEEPGKSMPQSSFATSTSRTEPHVPSSDVISNGTSPAHLLSSASTHHGARSDERISNAMPPSTPPNFSEDQARQYVTVYRLASLDHGLKKHVMEAPSFSGDSEVMRFHEARRQDILNAGGFPAMIQGLKRKAGEEIGKDYDSTGAVSSKKKARHDTIISHPPSNNKRKADEEIGKDSDNGGSVSPTKKSRPDTVSYPTLPSSSSSQTANLFASIANGTNSTSKSPAPNFAAPSATKGSQLSREAAKPVASEQGSQSSIHAPPASPFSFKPNQDDNKPSLQPVPNALDSKFLASSNNGPAAPPSNLFSFKPAASSGTQSTQDISGPLKSTKDADSASSGNDTPPNKTVSKDLKRSASQALDSGSDSDIATKAPKFSVPKFGAVSLAQFRKQAEEDAEKAKIERKRADFDSEEETEEEWEARDAEEQRAKKQKFDALSKSLASDQSLKFSLGKTSGGPASLIPASTIFPAFSTKQSSAAPSSVSGFASPALSATSGESVFANLKPSSSLPQSDNMFGHLSNPGSDAEGSKTGDADNEESDESEQDQGQKTPTPSQPAGRSMFDRIEQNNDGSLKRASIEEKEEPKNPFGSSFTQPKSSLPQSAFASPGKSIFSQPSSKDTSTNPFAQLAKPDDNKAPSQSSTPPKSTSLFGISTLDDKPFAGLNSRTSSSPVGDQTWKPDSPIKFSNTAPTPSVSVTAPSPQKLSSTEHKSGPFASLFGASTPSSNPPPNKPSSTLFSTVPTSSPAATAGFSFGGPPKPAANSLSATSVLTSAVTSRATSPGATSTGGESANESNAEEDTQKDEQISLVNARAGEEDEDILFEIRAKAREFAVDEKAEKEGEMTWQVRGIGNLRVLKHRQTKKARLVLRQDPSGKVVLNAALMETVEYKHTKDKTVNFGAATGSGRLASWMINVKNNDDARRLATVMESNKAN